MCCGCSFERSPLRTPDLANARAHAGNAGSSGNGGLAGDGTTITDTQPPSFGANAADGAIANGGAAHASDAGPSTSVDMDAATTSNTQHPRGSYPSCSSNSDCGSGQNCYTGNPTGGPGHCADQCTADADCTDYDGFDFGCYTLTGTCRIDCGASGSKGACPEGLSCVLDLTNNYRCRLPATTQAGVGGNGAPCPWCSP